MKTCSTFLLSLALLATACKKDKETPEEKPKPAAELTTSLNARISSIDTLSKFAAILKDLEVSDADATAGVTVFAPSNAAFTNAGGRRAPDFSGELREKLADSSELEDYIIKGKLAAADLTDGKTLTAINGKTLVVHVQNGQLYINAAPVSATGVGIGERYIMHALSALLNQDQLPAITALSDEKTFPGWLLTIEGKNFSTVPAENEVRINNLNAQVHTARADKLVVTVPFGATAGKVTVSINGRTVSSAASVAIMQAKVSTITALNGLGVTNVQGIAVDNKDNLYYTDYEGQRVIQYTPGGQVSVIQPTVQSTIDVNQDGIINGYDRVAVLEDPWGIAVDAQRNLYVNTRRSGVSAIYRVNTTTNAVELWVGGNSAGPATGPKNIVSMSYPAFVKFAPNGLLYYTVATPDGGLLVNIPASGNVTALHNANAFMSVDPAARPQSFTGMAFGADNSVYLADESNFRIWSTGPGGIRMVAGNGKNEAKDGVGVSAQFGAPMDIAVDQKGNLYVCDNDYTHNRFVIRMINPQGVVTTIAGGNGASQVDGPGETARFEGVNCIAADSKGVFYIGSDNGSIRKLSIE
ncbi:fasciclin domain-containing protein [Chitinophaga sp.]|uniref:fasciclin domain-containing protein n=1 Tax=Chitinophaga sp. TaxID=1869181 RepID=UPI0031DB1472